MRGAAGAARRSAITQTTIGRSNLTAAIAIRHNSTLPIIEEYVRRTYPFPTILESNIPPDYSNWLYYYQQHPHDLPTYKSKLTVDIRDLGLDPTSRMVLREMVSQRYDPRTHTLSFVAKNLPSAAANENRVFQMLDACLVECRRIGAEMNAEGFFAKNNGAVHNRMLKPTPTLGQLQAENQKKMQKKKKKQQALAAGSADSTAAASGASPVTAAAATPAKSISYTRSQKDHRTLGMESPHTTKALPPQQVKVLPRHQRKRGTATATAQTGQKKTIAKKRK